MFFAIPNLVSSVVFKLEALWDNKFSCPKLEDKNAFRRWGIDPHTQSAFVSCFEGLNPDLRISKEENPPFKMHGLLVDYDSRCSPNATQELQTGAYSEFLPAYFGKSFSNNARIYWAFERPIVLTNYALIKEFIQRLYKELRLNKWHAGLDTAALTNPSEYLFIGDSWEPVFPKKFIQASHLEYWAFEASKKVKLNPKIEYVVPLDKVAEEIEARWPGKWVGPFELGRRGVCFWNPQSTNPTSAVVCAEGMYSFSGDGFVPWSKILGKVFCEQFEANRISNIVDKTAYDGHVFWVKKESGDWIEMSKEDFSQKLRTQGYNATRARGETCSEVDRVEVAIKENRLVYRAYPFVHHESGLINWEKRTYLNIWNGKVMEPAPPYTSDLVSFLDGEEHFRLIYRVLRSLFTGAAWENKEANRDIQLCRFLAWLAYFYRNAYKKTPMPGQVVLLAGPKGLGKTLLNRKIVGTMVGGFAEASQHLVEAREWTESLAQSPMWVVDDQLASNDASSHKRFSNMLKAYVANHRICFNQKYVRTGELPFFGRIGITCNLDSESLRILPDIDLENLDKLSFFRTPEKQEDKVKFPSMYKVEQILAQERPYFARFLLDWEIPEDHISPDARFYVKSYHHPTLIEEAHQQGVCGIVLELLCSFLKSYAELNKDKREWAGLGTELFNNFVAMNPASVRSMTPNSLTTALGILSRKGYPITRVTEKFSQIRKWHIPFALLTDRKEVMQ
jgi:hypothetical protein